MDQEKLSSLKLNLFLFYSANAKQLQEQKKPTFKDKKDRISAGHPTYTSIMIIKRNPFSGIIKHSGFFKRLEQAHQSYKKT